MTINVATKKAFASATDAVLLTRNPNDGSTKAGGVTVHRNDSKEGDDG